MTTDSADRRELFELLAHVAAGSVTDEVNARLNALLAEDAEARALYIDYVTTDAMLRWTDNAAAPRDPISTILIDSVVQKTAAKAGRWRIAAALVAGLVIVGIIAAVIAVRGNDSAPVRGPVVAVLSDSDSAVMIESTGEVVSAGAPLRTGWLSVSRGTAEIAFDSGAMVRLEGPARFRLDSSMGLALSSGRLAADVPPNAVGFTVGVGDLSVVDLGTRFGIDIDAAGEPGVHVFDGRVRLDGRGGGKVVTAGSAYRASGQGLASIPLDRLGFSNLLASMRDDGPPVDRALALWLSADRGVERDADGGVRLWRDGRTHADLAAIQSRAPSRPRWVADGIDHRPAVRFDGRHYFQLPTTETLGIDAGDYEVFFVARTDDPSVQFLLAGSFAAGGERYEMHVHGDASLRFIPIPGVNKYADVLGEGIVGSAHVLHARVNGDTATAAIDGVDSDDVETIGAREPWVGELTLGVRGSGVYGFRGEVAEVLIYNGALTDEERAGVHDYLTERYTIEKEHDGSSDGDADHDRDLETTEPQEGAAP